jgi:hypothetical protein
VVLVKLFLSSSLGKTHLARSALTSLLAAAALLLSTAAQADAEYTTGNWTAFYVSKNSACGLKIQLANGG